MIEVFKNIEFSQINEEHLDILIKLKIKEDQVLDYKSTLDLGSDGKKKELCKDISAFANALGGTIIFGVEEDENGAAKNLLGIDFSDSIQNQFFQIIDNGIRPGILTENFKYKEVSLKNGKSIFIFYVLKSNESLQQEVKSSKYYKRVGTTTSIMNPSDIDAHYNSSKESSKDKSHNIFNTYISDLKNKYKDKPIIALTITPYKPSYIDLSNNNLTSCFDLKPINCSAWDYSWKGDYYYTFNENIETKYLNAKCELHSNGIIKSFSVRTLLQGSNPQKTSPIYLERIIITYIHKYIKSLYDLRIEFPYYINLGLLNFNNATFDLINHFYEGRNKCIENDIIFPILKIENDECVSDIYNLAKNMKSTLDYLWREFGLEFSYSYTKDGIYKNRIL